LNENYENEKIKICSEQLIKNEMDCLKKRQTDELKKAKGAFSSATN